LPVSDITAVGAVRASDVGQNGAARKKSYLNQQNFSKTSKWRGK